MAEGDTLTNSLIGAAVIVLTTPFVPFAPVVGGGVAGYLQGRDAKGGVTVGAVAGVISIVPLIALFVVIGNLFFFLFGAGGTGIPAAVGGFGFVVFLTLVVGMLLYVVVLSAVGGWLGSYLNAEGVV